jgi:hypothetical protein
MYIHGAIFKKLFKRKPFLRRVRVKGKSPPPHGDGVFLFELFDTPGNEVAPRSDVIGKYLKWYGYGHVSSSRCEKGSPIQGLVKQKNRSMRKIDHDDIIPLYIST